MSTRSMSLGELRRRFPKMRSVERSSDDEEHNRQRYLFRLSITKTLFHSLTLDLASVPITATIYLIFHEDGEQFSSIYIAKSAMMAVWFSWILYRTIRQSFEYDFMVPYAPDVYVDLEKKAAPWPLVALLSVVLILTGWAIIIVEPVNLIGLNILLVDMSDNDISGIIKNVIMIDVAATGSVLFLCVVVGAFKYTLRRRM